ncbi:MAG: hypothetical protein ABI690_18655 [Chloroflexota bacterium]
MKRVASGIIRLYARLLRLYPPQFRAEFADEMHEVFTQAIAETNDLWSLLGVMDAEVRDLPLSLIRQHLRERRQPMWNIEGNKTMKWLYSSKLLRFCTVTILVLCSLYGLAIVSSFFAFDMQTHTYQTANNWWYSYDSNPDFIGRRIPIGLFVFIVYMLTPPGLIVCGSALGLNVLGRWKQLAHSERRLALVALMAAALMIISLNTQWVYIGGLWFYD